MNKLACTENHITVRSGGQQSTDTIRVRLTSDTEKAPSQQLDKCVDMKRSCPEDERVVEEITRTVVGVGHKRDQRRGYGHG